MEFHKMKKDEFTFYPPPPPPTPGLTIWSKVFHFKAYCLLTFYMKPLTLL